MERTLTYPTEAVFPNRKTLEIGLKIKILLKESILQLKAKNQKNQLKKNILL